MSKHIEITTIGQDKNKGNIIGVDPRLSEKDYQNQNTFNSAIEKYIITAQNANLINNKTVFVYPEYIGTWLVAANAPKLVFKIKNSTLAMLLIALQSFPLFLKHVFLTNFTQALFLTKANEMLAIYQETFSSLAKKYQVTIVAGSIVLPEPSIKNGQVNINNKSKNIYNTSVVFDPDGSAHNHLTKKVFPIKEETSFTAKGNIEELSLYHTPAGNIALLICADSWFEQSYHHLKKTGVSALVVPSYLHGQNVWKLPWKGNQSNNEQLTEKEAWLKYAMPGKLEMFQPEDITGVNVFLHGKFWNFTSDGQSLIRHNGKIFIQSYTNSITNVWLG